MHKRRARTLEALACGVPCLAAHPRLKSIRAEFAEVYAVRKVRRATRRRLLEVLHSTRAIDTALAAFVGHHGCVPSNGRSPKSLGQYLHALHDHTVPGLRQLTKTQRDHFNLKIARPRNLYMHDAGTFPSLDADVQALLSEMAACLAAVARL